MITISKLTNYFVALYRYLILSVSSIAFYQDVRKTYRGYGIKYIFGICCISSLIYSLSLLYDLEKIQRYFVDNSNEAVEYIFSQVPDLNYDGQKITTNITLPHFIYDLHMRKFAAIDFDGELSGNDRAKIPIILTQKNIIISVIETAAAKRDNITLDYVTIFGHEPRILTATGIKEYFAYILSYSTRVFIYLIMPLLILARFVGLILEKTLAITAVYILSNVLGSSVTVQTACRLVMFSSGLSVLTQPIINIFIPQFAYLTLLLQIAPGIIMVMSLTKSKSNT